MTFSTSRLGLTYDDETDLRDYFVGGGGRGICLSSWWSSIVEASLSGLGAGADIGGVETRMITSLDMARASGRVAGRLDEVGPIHASTLRTYFSLSLLPLSRRVGPLSELGPLACLVAESETFRRWCEPALPSVHHLESLVIRARESTAARLAMRDALADAAVRFTASASVYSRTSRKMSRSVTGCPNT